MHRPFSSLLLVLCLALDAGAQTTTTPTIGGGAPSGQISYDFQLAFYRGNFQNQVAYPPIGNVMTLGATGLVQEFYNTAKTAGVKYALILPNKAVSGYANDIFQILSDVYGYYTTVGVSTAGYPTMDSQNCPGVATCTYDLFTNNYALFVIESGDPNGTNFSVSGNYYTKWTTLGGITGTLGVVYAAQKAVTSSTGVTGGQQSFNGGTVYSITSGLFTGQTFATLGAIDTLYQSYGGPTGALGFPVGDQSVSASTGTITQTFEHGKIQEPSGGTPVVLNPVAEIALAPAGPLTLSYGQSITVTAVEYDTNGYAAAGRLISFSTSNSRVVTVTPSGNTVVLQAVGGGTATITATSEGVSSLPIVVSVTAPCCQIGDGAPASIQQAFQNAVSRVRVPVQVPGPNPVKRVSNGYTQDLLSTDGVTHYLVAQSDSSGTAYVVAGAQLATYNQLGGVSGSLGFPASDLSPGGTQLFANNAALAGSPVQVVSGPVLIKWASLNYETGIAGTPTAAAVAFTTQSGYSGSSQAFTAGVIYGITNSNLAGQAFFVSGLILSEYLSAGGPVGELGAPLTDQFSNASDNRQNFENGYLDYLTGATAATENLVPRTPTISANPASALAGSRLHLSVSGFANGATLRVSVTGQPDFLVTTPNGSYGWDIYIAPAALTASVAVRAVDVSSGAVANGTYAVKSLSDAHPQLTKSSGDNQTGAPATVLALPLVITLRDSSNVPIPNVAVTFTVPTGAQILSASAVTDSSGHASASLRLPVTPGVTAVTARAAGQIAIFDAQAIGSAGVANFPQFSQASLQSNVGNGTATGAQKGALVTAAAALLRYYQNLGTLPAANGLADPNSLNRYLQTACTTTAAGVRTCDGFLTGAASSEQVVNLWRLVAFIGGNVDVSVETPTVAAIAPLVSGGDPVLVNLALTEDGAAAGGATVVATGIASDGSLTISDPNPNFAQTNLNGYLGGFSAGGHTWQGTLLSAARLLPRAPSATGFLLDAISQPVVSLSAVSPAGACGPVFIVQDAAVFGAPVNSPIRQSEFLYCDGSQPVYQVAVSASQPYQAAITDLTPAGATKDLSTSSPSSYQVTRTAGMLTIATPAVNFAASAVVNAASFTSTLAPGELISIFGSGLSGTGAATTITVNGSPAQLLLSSAFQINAVLPTGLAPGTYPLTIASSFGSLSQSVTIQPAAPGIFILSQNSDGTVSGAVVNQDGSINSPTNPLARGKVLTIYATGLGAVQSSGSLSTTTAPVLAVVGGNALAVAFAGLAPGFPGLYQVNVTIPAATPPGLALFFTLREGGIDSNAVSISIQ